MKKQKIYKYEEAEKIRIKKIQQEKQRVRKHDRLIQLVLIYSRTPEEQQRLIKIRKNTMMQIQLRYKKAQINTKYTFPRMQITSDSDDQIDRFPRKATNSSIFYDLKTQNQTIIRQKSHKHLKISTGRRVKSLNHQEEISPRRIRRYETNLNLNQGHELRLQRLRRWDTNPKNIYSSVIKLPKIKLVKVESPQKYDEKKIIKKKLYTQESQSRVRIKTRRFQD